jgi:hypothetical protein
MKALANCKAALEGRLTEQPSEQLRQLHTLVDSLETATGKKKEAENNRAGHTNGAPSTALTNSRVPSLASSRVHSKEATSLRVQDAKKSRVVNTPSYLRI